RAQAQLDPVLPGHRRARLERHRSRTGLVGRQAIIGRRARAVSFELRPAGRNPPHGPGLESFAELVGTSRRARGAARADRPALPAPSTLRGATGAARRGDRAACATTRSAATAGSTSTRRGAARARAARPGPARRGAAGAEATRSDRSTAGVAA